MNYDTYSLCNFVKLPNSVGIVPERAFVFSDLYFFSIIIRRMPKL